MLRVHLHRTQRNCLLILSHAHRFISSSYLYLLHYDKHSELKAQKLQITYSLHSRI